jgi:hypothetical protein
MNLTKRLFEREMGGKNYNKLNLIESTFDKLSLSEEYIFQDLMDVSIDSFIYYNLIQINH